jgi:hypothetical protein
MFASCCDLIPLHALVGSAAMSAAVLSANTRSAMSFKQFEVRACKAILEIEANIGLVSCLHEVPDHRATHCGVMLTKANDGILVMRAMPRQTDSLKLITCSEVKPVFVVSVNSLKQFDDIPAKAGPCILET